MKKTLIILVLFGIFTTNVSAKEENYINKNNVTLTEKEYNFISTLFYEGYQNIMNQNDYDNIFLDNNIINSEITSNTYYDVNHSISLYASVHETTSKILTIKKACTSDCLVTINVEWKKSPTIRSYDVIGAYLDGVTLTSVPITSATGTSERVTSNEIVQSNNGFGVSIKLPYSGSNMNVLQYFRVTLGGTVYGSYQHAKSVVSLASSKKYSISRSGYGGVFLFNNSVKSHYDQMAGVRLLI